MSGFQVCSLNKGVSGSLGSGSGAQTREVEGVV